MEYLNCPDSAISSWISMMFGALGSRVKISATTSIMPCPITHDALTFVNGKCSFQSDGLMDKTRQVWPLKIQVRQKTKKRKTKKKKSRMVQHRHNGKLFAGLFTLLVYVVELLHKYTELSQENMFNGLFFGSWSLYALIFKSKVLHLQLIFIFKIQTNVYRVMWEKTLIYEENNCKDFTVLSHETLIIPLIILKFINIYD